MTHNMPHNALNTTYDLTEKSDAGLRCEASSLKQCVRDRKRLAICHVVQDLIHLANEVDSSDSSPYV